MKIQKYVKQKSYPISSGIPFPASCIAQKEKKKNSYI